MTDLRNPPLGGARRSLCFVVAAPYTFHVFLKQHALRLLADGNSVTVCANLRQLGGDREFPEGLRVVDMQIERQISPLRDIIALARLAMLFRRERFDAVHSLTPKSGLLAMLAASMAGIKLRVHTFTGQVWATASGFRRLLLMNADRVIAFCASHVLADSMSQRDFLVSQRIVRHNKIEVLAHGSICGVDLKRFGFDAAARADIRGCYGIREPSVVILFAGRITREKGIDELLQAFADLQAERDGRGGPAIYLFMVGPNDGNQSELPSYPDGVIYLGYCADVERYYSAADIFCLPSYREGFGSVLIEAAAAGLPVVATRIYGITDAVASGETGLLVEPRDVRSLKTALATLIDSKDLRERMGRQGKARAQNLFSTEIVSEAWRAFYCRLLGALPAEELQRR